MSALVTMDTHEGILVASDFLEEKKTTNKQTCSLFLLELKTKTLKYNIKSSFPKPKWTYLHWQFRMFMSNRFQWNDMVLDPILRGRNWVLFAYRPYCYLEFKLRYLTNLKLFSIRVKELFKLIVLRRKGDGFLLFLKAFSSETDFWVTVGDFRVKNAKLGRKIFI